MKTLVIKIHFEMNENIIEEEKALQIIYHWANSVFPSGYTIYKTRGVWKGLAKESFTIERYDRDIKLVEKKSFKTAVKRLAKRLKQKEVLVTFFEANIEKFTPN